MRQLQLLRFEWLLQVRTLRFRVGVPLYLGLCMVPSLSIFLAIRNKSNYVYGAGTYLTATLDIQKFLTVLLAVLVAGARADIDGWNRMVPVLGGSPIGNAAVLLRRWLSIAAILGALSIMPIVGTFGIAYLAEASSLDPMVWGARWLISILPILLVVSACWLSITTIAGSELGGLMLLFASSICLQYLGTRLGEVFGLPLSPNLEWLGFYDLQYGFWRLSHLLTDSWRRQSYSIILDTDAPFDLATEADQLAPLVVMEVGITALVFGLAMAFLRRNRSDVRPFANKEDHPLRTILRHVHKLRYRYAPDGALRWEKWAIAAGFLALAAATAVLASYQERYRSWIDERYASETEGETLVPTPAALIVAAWDAEGEIGTEGEVRLHARARLENQGDQPVDHLAWTANPFLVIEADGHSYRVEEKAWDRRIAKIEPALGPGESLDLEMTIRGRPRHPTYELDRRRRRESFVIEYRSSARDEQIGRNPLALSESNPSISAANIILQPGDLLPVLRYETWKLTPPPTLEGEPGLRVPEEASFPLAELSMRLRLPPGQVLADSCGNYSRDGLFESQCLTSPGRYWARGGRLSQVESRGGATLFALRGHETLASRHFEALEMVRRLAYRAWPGLGELEEIVAIEMPGKRGRVGRQPNYSILVYGNLIAIPEWWVASEDTLTVESVVGKLLARRLLERRNLSRGHAPSLEAILTAVMARRMGLERPGGATMTGVSWDKANATRAILRAYGSNRFVFSQKIPALLTDLDYRVGSERLQQAMETFLARESEEPATVEELLADVTAAADFDVEAHYGFFFEEHGFPELAMEGLEVLPSGDGSYRVVGSLLNRGQGATACDVVVRSESREARRKIEVGTAERVEFSIEIAEEPHTAVLDPEKTCFRWADRGSDRVDRVSLKSGR